MKKYFLFLGFLIFVIDLTAQCNSCTFHEIDESTNTVICDLPEIPNSSCSISIDTCFSGALISAFLNTPIVDDSVDSQNFIIPPNMVVKEIEWCIFDQGSATSGTISVGSYTANFTGMGMIDTICVVHTLTSPLNPGLHSFSVSGNLQFISYVD